MTEAITRQTGSNPFVPFNIKPVSNPYPYSEEEKSRKGAPSAQQDKGLVQSASVPSPTKSAAGNPDDEIRHIKKTEGGKN